MKSPVLYAGPLVALATLLSVAVSAQPRAGACFFSADLEGDEPLQGWDLGPAVERQDASGLGLGEFVPAWTVGNASDANIAGYFPVWDFPVGNRFAMANDAAPPCNCGMADVALTTPTLDLTTRTGVGLECRIFHDGQFGATGAIEASVSNGPWAELRPIGNSTEWQRIAIDLSAFDGQADVRIRFRWNDNGDWAGGFAVDDICLLERVDHDISMLSATFGDVTVSAFSTDLRTLSYSALPLEQANAFSVSLRLVNRGLLEVPVTGVNVNVILNGESQIQASLFPIGVLQAGADTVIVVPIDWIPDATGLLELACSLDSGTPDDDPADNSATVNVRITGPGWDDGYGAMASDNGIGSSTVGGTEQFIAANRMEVTTAGSTAHGISFLLGPDTQIGGVVRAILMDANHAVVDTSTRLTIDQEIYDGIWSGAPIYLPLSLTPELTVGDHFVGIQHLLSDNDHAVYVRAGGAAQFGQSTLRSGLGFTLNYLSSIPMVRLHLSAVDVGVAEAPNEAWPLVAYPVPANKEVQFEFTTGSSGPATMAIVDPTGRMVRTQDLGVLPAGRHRHTLDLGEMPAGVYLVRLQDPSAIRTVRIQLVH